MVNIQGVWCSRPICRLCSVPADNGGHDWIPRARLESVTSWIQMIRGVIDITILCDDVNLMIEHDANSVDCIKVKGSVSIKSHHFVRSDEPILRCVSSSHQSYSSSCKTKRHSSLQMSHALAGTNDHAKNFRSECSSPLRVTAPCRDSEAG